MTPEDFRKQGYALIDWIADYLEGVERFPVASTTEPGWVRDQLPAHPPTETEPFDAVLADLDRVDRPRPDPLAAPQLLRLLPRQHQLSVDPR